MERVVFSGYTPRVHDASLLPHLRDKLDREIHKTALGAEDMLDIYSCDDIMLELNNLRKNDWQILGLENNIDVSPLYKLGSAELAQALSSRVVLVLGEEVNGINNSLYDIIDLFAEIPMKGQKESFNVSVAAGIAIFALANI